MLKPSLHRRVDRLEETARTIRQIESDPDVTAEILREVPEKALDFCRKLLEFKPTDYQAELLEKDRQFIAARFCRQSGKTWTITARILHKMLRNPGSWWAAFGPSYRQSKQVIGNLTRHLLKLKKSWYHKPLKTKIGLANGSRIEAFPINPETIRGPTVNGIYCDHAEPACLPA